VAASEVLAQQSATGKRWSGYWVVAFAFLIVMSFATLPSPLYGIYKTHDQLSSFTITIIYAIFAAGTIAALLAENRMQHVLADAERCSLLSWS
jgi:hypothetical protein